MSELFLNIINMSISASLLVFAVLILRLVLKKAPKWVNVLLWGIVAVRLICPFTIESPVSLVPDVIGNGELVSEWMDDYISEIDIHHTDSIYYDAAIGAGRTPIPDGEGNFYVVTKHDQLGEPATIENTVLPVLSVVWVAGMTVLAIYTLISYGRLRRKVETAVLYQDNIFRSENVTSPFVLGIIKPKIYLPFHIDGQELEQVVAHEQAHIHRRDHWWKPLGFLLLTVYWFNPLMWLAYVLLCRDIELACDEKVIRELGNEQRADYTRALLTCSVNRRRMEASPLAFGEVGVKERVKSVMNYRKPALGIVVLSVIFCVIIVVCFLTNPITKNTVVMGANYVVEKVLYEEIAGDEVLEKPPLQYCITADYHLYEQQNEDAGWNYLGVFTPYDLTKDELYFWLPDQNRRKAVKVHAITDAYILQVEDDHFYLVFQTKAGETCLAYGLGMVGERAQADLDDTQIRWLYLLDSSFRSGSVNVNFFERSLKTAVGENVYVFANYESDKIPGYLITGFKAGDSSDHSEMTDLGFAVFRTTGEGCRFVDCKVYENAALVENGIFLCPDPAVADVHGEMRNDDTFDVVMILNEEVERVERVYHIDGKEDRIQADIYMDAPCMSLWSWEDSDTCTSISQYVYDKNGNQIPYDSVIPVNSASWKSF